jgi:hypothetical protein
MADMAGRKVSPIGEHQHGSAFPAAELVDQMLSRYVSWREHAAAATDAYRRWCAAPADERAARISAYLAALDLEESSAKSYAALVAAVERSLSHGRAQSA